MTRTQRTILALGVALFVMGGTQILYPDAPDWADVMMGMIFYWGIQGMET